MKVYTLWITRKDAPDAPELVEAWDEYSADGNWKGMFESFEEAKLSIGGDLHQWRQITLMVNLDVIEAAFADSEVKAQVDA